MDPCYDLVSEDLHIFLTAFTLCAQQFQWNVTNGPLQIQKVTKKTLLSTYYGQLTLKEVKLHILTNVHNQPICQAQDDVLIFQCLDKTISPEGKTTLFTQKED